VRVRAARDLLRAESRSITEISYRCGFADAAHFSRRFRSHFGLSPRSFRRGAAER
jgi:transcriptional regulator GlxA family with amidase domain